MKIFNMLIILFLCIICHISNYALDTTMYACCSPYGLCDLRLFDSKSICMASCSGHNKCEARTVQASPTVLPVAYRAPYVSALTTSIATRATPFAVTPNIPVAPIITQPVVPVTTVASPYRVVEAGAVTTEAPQQ